MNKLIRLSNREKWNFYFKEISEGEYLITGDEIDKVPINTSYKDSSMEEVVSIDLPGGIPIIVGSYYVCDENTVIEIKGIEFRNEVGIVIHGHIIDKPLDTKDSNSVEDLKSLWDNVCNKYADEFVKKHSYTKYKWDNKIVGGYLVASVGSYDFIDYDIISMDDIRYDIDNNIPCGKFEEWYEYNSYIDSVSKDLRKVPYKKYLEGVRPYSIEDLDKLNESKKRVSEAKHQLLNLVSEINNKIINNDNK